MTGCCGDSANCASLQQSYGRWPLHLDRGATWQWQEAGPQIVPTPPKPWVLLVPRPLPKQESTCVSARPCSVVTLPPQAWGWWGGFHRFQCPHDRCPSPHFLRVLLGPTSPGEHWSHLEKDWREPAKLSTPSCHSYQLWGGSGQWFLHPPSPQPRHWTPDSLGQGRAMEPWAQPQTKASWHESLSFRPGGPFWGGMQEVLYPRPPSTPRIASHVSTGHQLYLGLCSLEDRFCNRPGCIRPRGVLRMPSRPPSGAVTPEGEQQGHSGATGPLASR